MIALSDSSFVTGSALGAASMLSVGPNNLLMIREGMNQGRVVVVPTIVMLCYSACILAAFEFADQIARLPTEIRVTLAFLGIPIMIYFSIMCFFSAAKSRRIGVEQVTQREPIQRCVLRTLTVLLCNPLLYIELLIVPASICAVMNSQADRLTFVIGLILTSSIYCFGFSFGARYLIRVLRISDRLAFFDAVSGAMLLGLAMFMMRNLSGSPS